MKTINFALVIHSHQPVGNFNHIIEQAYRNAYQPFLDAIEGYPEIPFTLHYSGCLLEWLAEHHRGFCNQLRRLVARGQVELLGGGFYEPIFSMLTQADVRGQVTSFSDYLEEVFQVRPQGIWLAERVWEQEFTRLLADLGIRYTVLDDVHFKFAGLKEEELLGYFLTEDQGRLLSVFPGSEQLRYWIPFRPAEQAVRFLKSRATEAGDGLIVYADDGEKFGMWPGTHKHVYRDGWLAGFLKLLADNRDWLKLIRLGDALEKLQAAGKVYLPDASYREMGEWALPADALATYERMTALLEEREELLPLKRFIRGGFWRNFQVKYPEANLLYARMMQVSRKVNALPKSSTAFTRACRELYRGQCNCAYWHGIFGGLYLPHLRSAVYKHLIAAERLADTGKLKSGTGTRIEVADFDMDGAREVSIYNRKLSAYLKPGLGGALYELDLRSKNFNLLATLSRQPETYHRDLLARAQDGDVSKVRSIHDLRFAKEQGLEKKLIYDHYPRRSLLDHFLPLETSLSELVLGKQNELGDFLSARYDFQMLDKQSSAPAIKLERCTGVTCGKEPLPVRVNKIVRLAAKGSALSAAYKLTNQSHRRIDVVFAIEFNFALLAGDSPGSFYHLGNGEPLGDLSLEAELAETKLIALKAEVPRVDVLVQLDEPTRFWCFPIKTISQSESGLELVYQSSVVLPFWKLHLEPGKCWTQEVTLAMRSF